MLDLKQLGAAGAAGVLLGIVLVVYVEPTTQGGTALTIFVSWLVTTVVWGLIRALFFRAKK